jgi:hypothetical protein
LPSIFFQPGGDFDGFFNSPHDFSARGAISARQAPFVHGTKMHQHDLGTPGQSTLGRLKQNFKGINPIGFLTCY